MQMPPNSNGFVGSCAAWAFRGIAGAYVNNMGRLSTSLPALSTSGFAMLVASGEKSIPGVNDNGSHTAEQKSRRISSLPKTKSAIVATRGSKWTPKIMNHFSIKVETLTSEQEFIREVNKSKKGPQFEVVPLSEDIFQNKLPADLEPYLRSQKWLDDFPPQSYIQTLLQTLASMQHSDGATEDDVSQFGLALFNCLRIPHSRLQIRLSGHHPLPLDMCEEETEANCDFYIFDADARLIRLVVGENKAFKASTSKDVDRAVAQLIAEALAAAQDTNRKQQEAGQEMWGVLINKHYIQVIYFDITIDLLAAVNVGAEPTQVSRVLRYTSKIDHWGLNFLHLQERQALMNMLRSILLHLEPKK